MKKLLLNNRFVKTTLIIMLCSNTVYAKEKTDNLSLEDIAKELCEPFVGVQTIDDQNLKSELIFAKGVDYYNHCNEIHKKPEQNQLVCFALASNLFTAGTFHVTGVWEIDPRKYDSFYNLDKVSSYMAHVILINYIKGNKDKFDIKLPLLATLAVLDNYPLSKSIKSTINKKTGAN